MSRFKSFLVALAALGASLGLISLSNCHHHEHTPPPQATAVMIP